MGHFDMARCISLKQQFFWGGIESIDLRVTNWELVLSAAAKMLPLCFCYFEWILLADLKL